LPPHRHGIALRVQLNVRARAIIADLNKVRPINHNHVFDRNGKPIRSIRTAFENAAKKIGLPNFRFHDLRHTFVTNMRRAGNHESIIMSMTGHKTRAMFDRYNTIEQTDAKEALVKFDSFLTKFDCNMTASGFRGKKGT
jgi:integrase